LTTEEVIYKNKEALKGMGFISRRKKVKGLEDLKLKK